MTDMSAEHARGKGNESPDTQSERWPPGSCMYVSPEPQTLATERQPRVRRSVCVLLVLFATLFIITLAVSLCVIIALLFIIYAFVSTATGTVNEAEIKISNPYGQ